MDDEADGPGTPSYRKKRRPGGQDVDSESGPLPEGRRTSQGWREPTITRLTVTLDSESVEMRAYIDSDDAVVVLRIWLAIMALIESVGYGVPILRDVEPGSVFMKFRTWVRATTGRSEIQTLAEQVRQLAEAMTVDKARAENASMLATAVADLAEKSRGAKSVVVDGDALAYLQWVDDDGETHIRSWSRSSRDLAVSRISDTVMRDPQEFMQQLDRVQGAEGVPE